MKQIKETNQLKYNLQFFAEPTDPQPQDPEPAPQDPTPQDPKPEPQLSVEEELARLRADSKKWKSQFDKASTEVADYKKRYRDTLSEKEQLDLEKVEREAEREEKFNVMERQLKVIELEKNFLKLGYDEKTANEAAKAQLDGDTDQLFRLQSSYQERRDRDNLAKYMKDFPTPNGGAGDSKEEDLFIKGFKSVK